jgi:hypothetical protein
MNRVLDALFGLDGMRFGSPDVEFGFARPFPAWAWFLGMVAVLAVALWSYSRLEGDRRIRWALAGTRALVLLLLLFIISGPQLVRPNERVERDWVLVLVDRSASMSIADVEPGVAGAGGRITREQQLRTALDGARDRLNTLTEKRTVVWLGFDGGVYDLESPATPTAGELGDPRGPRTRIGSALDQALARAAARPVSGVIVLSDGRSADTPGRAALRRLQAEHIPVYTVPLGNPEPIEDLAVAEAQIPQLAFIRDTVPVTVDVDRLGAAEDRPARGRVRLLEKATGLVLDEQPLPTTPGDWRDGRTTVVLTTRPEQPGTPTWIVRVVPDGPDLISENNEAELRPELVDRPLRVLYFDGYPRWEYRYLKNLLVRERSVRSASLLLASNRQYLQEGDVEVRSLPRSPEEWAAFDVIVMGDVQAGLFSREQLEQLREHVAVRGGGLLWVAGPTATPGSWRDTPLADLLPFSMGTRDQRNAPVTEYEEPVTIAPAEGAERLGVLELSGSPTEPWPARLSDPATGWSRLRWAQRIDPEAVKPTAEVLAWAAPVSAGGARPGPAADGQTPAVLTMRYGAGRVLYVATDEIWRWRYARGEALPERFWLPLLRLQGRESLARTSRSASLEARPRRASAHQPVRISIELLDQALVDAVGGISSLRVRASRVGAAASGEAGPSGEAPAEVTLSPEGGGARASMRTFAGVWLPDLAGTYRLEAIDPLLAGLGLQAEVEVALDDDEMRRPETDHPLLAELSAETEGQLLPPESLGRVADLLPNRELRVAGTPDVQTLWDRPIVLAALLLLLAFEWITRRLIRLP